jgi:N-acetylneuraminate synthase
MGKPYLIAEIGVNYYDTARALGMPLLDAAKLYIDKAFEAGADCAKFQSYKAGALATRNSPAYWDTSREPARSQYELFQRHDLLDEGDYGALAEHAHKIGIGFTSTPFDYRSADYLSGMVDFFKISSSDITNLPFIRHIASKGKPVALSVGASYLSEVDEAFRILDESRCPGVTLMHCILSYPARPEDASLRVIGTLRKCFPKARIGYSDHVPPDASMAVLTAAFLLGAEVIEKHFTLDKSLKGNDHYHAGDPGDFKRAARNFELLEKALGSPEKTVLECEENSRREARRSLALARGIKAGEVIGPEDLVAKRPGTGIAPRFLDLVVGRKAARDLSGDDVLRWEDI